MTISSLTEVLAQHRVSVIDQIQPKSVRFGCSCGAKWSVSTKEFHDGTDHIQDHWNYAQRTATRPD